MSDLHRPSRPTWVVFLFTLAGRGASAGEPGLEGARAEPLSRLPLAFVENQGQWDTPARFVARKGGMTARIEDDGIVLQLVRRDGEARLEGIVVRLRFEGALGTVAPEGEGKQPGIYNFFMGNDPSKWRTEVPGYASVRYRGLQDGVDLRVREEKGRLEYDLMLAPGADLDRVVVRCEGTEGIAVEPDGSLAMKTALGSIRQSPPFTWQVLGGGERMPIEASFRLLGPDRFGFRAPTRDPSLALVIDPGLLYSTFLGGAGADDARALALDASGAATVVGETWSSDFPTTAGAYDTSFTGGSRDAFVARISPSGGGLLYSTFLGGSSDERALGVALDPSGAATVTGESSSSDFPTTGGAFDTTFNGVGPLSNGDAFVARLSPSGGSLLYSTFLGGANDDFAWPLALDPSGAATVAGSTFSSDFPTTAGAYDTSFSFGGATPSDGFLARLSPSGGSLLYSTLLGGTGGEYLSSLALDPSGAATVAGSTLSSNFPTTAGAYDTSLNGAIDAFVSRLSPSGGSLLLSTFLGGSGGQNGRALALDASGAATVAGETASSDFPTTPGAYDTSWNGTAEAFVSRLSPSGGSLLYSTFLGGNGYDAAYALAVDASGAATVAGITSSSNLPTTPGAYDTSWSGTQDTFVSRLSPSGGNLLYSTFLGGADLDGPFALVLDAGGAAAAAGFTSSPDFPTTAGATDTSYNGGAFPGDAFVSHLDLLPAGASAYGAATPGCAGPPAIGVTSMPQAGNTSFAITCTNGPPNLPPNPGLGVIAFSLAALPSPLVVSGVSIWIDLTLPPFLLILVGSSPLGSAEAALPIPNDPFLVGMPAFAQFFWPDPCAPGGFSASNALAVTVQP